MRSGRLLIVGIIVLGVLVFQCTETEDGAHQNTTRISIGSIEGAKLSDIVKKVQYLKLSGTPDGSLAQIDKVLISGPKIYVFDYFSSRTLSVYDLKGNFDFTLSASGYGPGEFYEPKDFIVTDSTIEILDSSNKIIGYDLEGTFTFGRKATYNPYKFSKISSNEYIFRINHLNFIAILIYTSAQADEPSSG